MSVCVNVCQCVSASVLCVSLYLFSRLSSGGDVVVVKKLLVALYQMSPQLLPELSTCVAPIDCTCEVSHFIYHQRL